MRLSSITDLHDLVRARRLSNNYNQARDRLYRLPAAAENQGRPVKAPLDREDVPAVLDEERVVMALVRVFGVVLRARWGAVRQVLLGVDGAHRTDVRLVAGGG